MKLRNPFRPKTVNIIPSRYRAIVDTFFTLSSPLDRLGVRLHGLKMGCEESIAVLPVIQSCGSARGEEGRIGHAEESKHRTEIGLNKIERGHPRLGVIDSSGRDDECCFLAGE